MKKFLIALIMLCFIFTCGCEKAILLNSKKEKPSPKYYSEKLINSFSSGSCKVRILSTDFYRSVAIDEVYYLTIRKFFKYVPKENFGVKPDFSKISPKYKMFIDFNDNQRYVINIYNESLITVFPWDGIYDVDCISMQNTYTSYNLFYLCDYITKNLK
ncbi:DOmain of unknown function [Hathewaya proteolytica DSM 3090]|uniref:Lipoprotein n=1 Tax=Hathewaya proteolytica DSM 3090 TaxID=1121331 RepID=A0A1M6LE52_9CLOT|nr:DUF4883 family protein [Hathewaya proteolytica]SHJ69511.1 DOmain of unknown function [Hathewaya proteolytica DSM 3090]